MTVLAVVLMFALFILLYFPARQEQYLIQNYNEEIENFANTVALGVKIALTEQNFVGVETAIDFVRNDKRLGYVSLIVTDTVPGQQPGEFKVEKSVFKTFPEYVNANPNDQSNAFFIVKRAPFSTPNMSGEVLLSFSTEDILRRRKQVRFTSMIASLVVFAIGLIMGFWLARNISRPVLALRDAAQRVGLGDLSQSVDQYSSDEIGELSIAFNKMVRDLSIESSLEKVRNRAMAMQHSRELPEVVQIFFEQLQQLHFDPIHTMLVLNHGEKGIFDCYMPAHDEQYQTIFVEGKKDQFAYLKLDEAQSSKEQFTTLELSGDDKNAYINNLLSQPGNQLAVPAQKVLESKEKLLISMGIMNCGAIVILRLKPLQPEFMFVLQRLSQVFDQAYTRYLDLQKNETRARDIARQAALDRVRGQIASMRTKEDLNQITPVIWKELEALNVPFIRCGVFIVNEADHELSSYLSTPDGKALGVFDIEIGATKITTAILDYWKRSEFYFEHWDRHDFEQWTQSILKLGHIQNQKNYQGGETPPENLDLHFIPFEQGMLYVGNDGRLSKEKLELVHSLAEAFSIAYARYEDFKKLEAAKEKTEQTLEELKATQSQLIHAEKMASLGELTAGIAHEIQNPLNFVNNFSEVSVDLIQEFAEEFGKPAAEQDQPLEEELLSDVVSNLQKINHHGKRASSIVKGMLEHSRTGDRQKEPIDINNLADEYLRLAYHGMRAKNKSFSADYQFIPDKKLPKVKVIYQDLGRVLLNIINNALYAVAKRAEREPDTYLPSITVKTNLQGKQAEIRISDNADGIPPDVMDKIFQPFFTTKPTGEGTGLGLSLSYDIITKGHGGALKIDTRQGEGTTFIILLPI